MKCDCISEFEKKYAEHFRVNTPDVFDVESVTAGHMLFTFGEELVELIGTVPVEVVYFKKKKGDVQKGARKIHRTSIMWKFCPLCGMDQRVHINEEPE